MLKFLSRIQMLPTLIMMSVMHDTLTKDRQLTDTSVAQRTRSKSKLTTDDDPDADEYKTYLLLANTLVNEANYTPETFGDAVDSSESEQWRSAMREEINSLLKNKTWSLVERSRCKRPPLKSRWVYKTKLDQNGRIECFKARLVLKGCSQKAGVDYTETFAPVARFETIRAVLSVAAQKGYHLTQFDIKTAFLNGELEEELYMEQPEVFDDKSGRVCHLLKSLYGLRQAPRAWNNTFNRFLQNHGLTQSLNDPCLYTSTKLILVLYVDDGLIASESAGASDQLLRALFSTFEAKTSNACFYLGLQIERSSDRSDIKIHQCSYVNSLLVKFKMSDCNPSVTPAEDSLELEINKGPKSNAPYRQLIGGLMYLTVSTRPDIAFVVHKLSQFLENPSDEHWTAAKRVLRYLKQTPKTGIVFSSKTDCPGRLFTYTDADFAMCIDTRKSTSGVVVLLNDGPIAWMSRKQGVVSCSTTDAEYVAAHDGARETVWLRRLLCDLKTLQNNLTPLFIDNKAARRLIENDSFHQRTKHIDIKFHYKRDVHLKHIIVTPIHTKEQLADIFTKPLPASSFCNLKTLLNII